jgi:hypothetical protein
MPLTILLASAICFGSFPVAAIAQQFIPPDRGLPGRREGGGTRGCWRDIEGVSLEHPLTALTPQQNFGYTISAYPTFFVYVPEFYAAQAVAAEFLLLDEVGNDIYQARFQTDATHGLIRITLPQDANLLPLEVGKDYQWSFTLICDAAALENFDFSASILVDSWIQRIEPDPELAAGLASASPEEQVNLLAEAGIWYDALNVIAEQDGDTAMTQWTNMLEAVNLGQLADELSVQTIELSSPELTSPDLSTPE